MVQRQYPPTGDRDRSRLSRWWDTVPQWQRVAIVLGSPFLLLLLLGLLAACTPPREPTEPLEQDAYVRLCTA
ncbi:hypothetical protein BH24GEM3_BH24GEM3_12110 [soil metagenome]